MLAIESRLDRAFAIAVTAILCQIGWPLALVAMEQGDSRWGTIVFIVLSVLVLLAYVWYAIAVGKAARAVDRPGGLFTAWVLGAPFAAFLVRVPLLGTIIAVSPLSLKFVLSGELRSKIHDKTFRDE
jgi:hypothetical protein